MTMIGSHLFTLGAAIEHIFTVFDPLRFFWKARAPLGSRITHLPTVGQSPFARRVRLPASTTLYRSRWVDRENGTIQSVDENNHLHTDFRLLSLSRKTLLLSNLGQWVQTTGSGGREKTYLDSQDEQYLVQRCHQD